jgi:hypothetical protein
LLLAKLESSNSMKKWNSVSKSQKVETRDGLVINHAMLLSPFEVSTKGNWQINANVSRNRSRFVDINVVLGLTIRTAAGF